MLTTPQGGRTCGPSKWTGIRRSPPPHHPGGNPRQRGYPSEFMKVVLKGLLILIAIPVVVVAGAFVYGIVAGLRNPEAFKNDGEAAGSRTEAGAQTHDEPVAPDPGPAPSTTYDAPELRPGQPEPLPANPAAFMVWLESQGIIEARDGRLLAHPERMARVDLELALRAYQFLKSAGKSRREERLLWFALCAHLPVEERRVFLEETDAILPKSLLERSRSYTGDYALLLNHMGSAFEAPYREAIYLYCEVMSEQDLLDSLRQFRVYEIPLTASQGGWTKRWASSTPRR